MAKAYFKANTAPPLITILALYVIALIFYGPYHFDKQQRQASSESSQGLQNNLNVAKANLDAVTRDRNTINSELEAERTKPLDPGLMTAGSAFGMAGQIHETISRFPAVVFVVTAPPDNAAFGSTLTAMVSAACGYGDQHLACNVQTISPVPRAPDNGIVMHVIENVDRNDLLLDALYRLLAGRFFLTKTQDITPEVLTQIKCIAGTRVVWFQVGHQSPWRGDSQRTQEGVSQSVIDSLQGWRQNPEERAMQLGRSLEESYKRIESLQKAVSAQEAAAKAARPGGVHLTSHPALSWMINNAVPEYNQFYKSRVIVLLQDLKVQGVDVKDTDSLAENPKSYEDIGEIGKRLSAYAKQIKKP
jgi:hypothetical protein